MFLRDIDLFRIKIAGLILFVFGLIVIIISFIELNNYNKKPIEFNSIIDSDIKKGLIVEGDIPYNLGKYTYGEDRRDGFVVPINSQNYFSLHVINGYLNDKLMQQSRDTNDMFKDNSNFPDVTHFKGIVKEISSEYPEVIHLKGIIKEMPSAEYNMMSSYLVENGFSQNDIQKIVKPYYIIVLDEYKAKEGIFMGIFIMLFGLIFLIIYLKNKSKSWIFIND